MITIDERRNTQLRVRGEDVPSALGVLLTQPAQLSRSLVPDGPPVPIQERQRDRHELKLCLKVRADGFAGMLDAGKAMPGCIV